MSDWNRDLRGDDPVSRYQEFQPSPRLSRRLLCAWAQVVGDGARSYLQHVLPDGCVDLIWIGSAPPIVVGPATRFAVTPLPPRTLIVGARFRPGQVPQALGVPASELMNREVALKELWGSSAELLADPIAEHGSIQARLAAIEHALASRWVEAPSADPLVRSAVAWLARHPGERVHRLAAQLGVSSRHLQRRFVPAVGYGPKTFQRIVRFQQLLALGMRRPSRGPGLGELALAAGYADQAHMTREVGELAGRTPTELLGRTGSTLGMSELFKTVLEPPA